MASELKVDKFTGVTTAGSISVTGEGGSTTTNLQQGLAKVWCFATEAAVLTDSFNMTSGTDNGTGDYSFTIANNMNNATYAILNTVESTVSTHPVANANVASDATTTTLYRVHHAWVDTGNNLEDLDRDNYHAVFGDLA